MAKDIIELYVASLKWKKRYHDCNPDVGMGPSLGLLLDYLIKETGVKLTDNEKDKVIKRVEKR